MKIKTDTAAGRQFSEAIYRTAVEDDKAALITGQRPGARMEPALLRVCMPPIRYGDGQGGERNGSDE